MTPLDLRIHTLALSSFVCIAACAGDSVPADDAIEETGDSTEEAGDSTEEAGDSTEEAGDATEEETDDSTEETGDSTSETGPEPDCIPLAMTPVDHIAFDGEGCNGAPSESMVLMTQAEVDAHTDAFCQSCCESCTPSQGCSKAPHLAMDSMIIYTFGGTPTGEANMEILSVEDCGESIVVNAFETTGCELAFSSAWNSVAVAALAKPVEFNIELAPPPCDEPP
jgi:hypothetical protein